MSRKNNVLKFPGQKVRPKGQSRPQTKDKKPQDLHNTAEDEKLQNLSRELIEKSARCLLKALDFKDNYTYGHSMRVAFYSLELGKELGLSQKELYNLELAALFHDVGKIGVPDAVLLKPSRLDDQEFLEMKAHPEKSGDILDEFEELKDVARYARHHHERYDGRGYPDSLKGEDIPLFSRIILIADTFDAMTSSRPYRKGLPYDVAFGELMEFAGSQFDPNLVEKFIVAMKKDQIRRQSTFSLNIIAGKFKKDAA